MKTTIACILADHGVITSTEHPRLRSAMARLKRAGVLDNPLPGTFVLAADVSERAWLRAVCAWSAPLGVLHTTTAASLWLPSLAGQTAVLAHPTLKSRRRIKVTRRGVPGDFVQMADGLRFATPAYAAVELAATDDGRAVCEALRRRLANRRLRLSGVVVHPDVLFPGARVVIEFDDRAVHDDPAQFLKDRERQNVLVAHGYVVLRFGWEHLDQPEYIVSMVRHALRTAGRIK